MRSVGSNAKALPGQRIHFALVWVALFYAILGSSFASAAKFDGPYVRESHVKNLKTLVTLVQTVMAEKTVFPKYSSLGLKINTAEGVLGGSCQELSPAEASDKILFTLERAVPGAIWKSIPKLIHAVEEELKVLWTLSDSLDKVNLCISGGRGQGYLDGNVSMQMSFMIRELSQEESAATFNKRSFDNIVLYYSAVEWVE